MWRWLRGGAKETVPLRGIARLEQVPVKEVNRDVAPGLALSVTIAPWVKVAVHCPGQSMPADSRATEGS